MHRLNLLSGEHFARLVRFLRKWSYLLCLLLPIGGYLLVLTYFTPDPLLVSFKVSCSEDGCRAEETSGDTYSSDLQLQQDQVNRLEQFSKPFSGFIRLNPRIINKSTFLISVSNPKQDFPQLATIICGEEQFPYNAEIPFNEKTTLANVLDTEKSITGFLKSCVRRIQTPADLKVTVGPNVAVFFRDPKPDFLIEFHPDTASKILVAIQVTALFLAFLPLYREGIRFLRRGWLYFT